MIKCEKGHPFSNGGIRRGAFSVVRTFFRE
jgi:hypothetical protein